MCISLILIFTKSCEIILIINSILQRNKLKNRWVKKLSQGHTAMHGESGVESSSRVCALNHSTLNQCSFSWSEMGKLEAHPWGFTRKPQGSEKFDNHKFHAS